MVLKKELGIDNSEKLAIEEERYGKIGALELFLEKETSQAGTFETLAYIHRKLFSKVYAHAGKMREINIAKGNFRFAPILFLNASIEAIESMPQSSFDEILEKYVEMNIAHPFREGNGRACRIWLDHMLKKELGFVIDWSQVDKERYLSAMEQSPICDLEIKRVLTSALSDQIQDRILYMKGIDRSFYFEGFDHFSTMDLDKLEQKSDLYLKKIDPSDRSF